MPIELNTYFAVIEGNRVQVTPKGVFEISVEKEGSYYRQILNGTMTFVKEDYDTIYYAFKADECTTIFLEANIKGIVWNGFFNKMDCKIHHSKRYIEVTPHTKDYYGDLLPYMGLDFNILPEFAGITPVENVYGIRVFPTERKVVEINHRYTGTESKPWVGWSVNDWVGGNNATYINNLDSRNSLISYLRTSYIANPSFATKCRNQLIWIDYIGFKKAEIEEYNDNGVYRALYDFDNTVPECFTLTKVINHYDKNDEFVKCQLVYEREVWEGLLPPPSGYETYERTVNPASYALYLAYRSQGINIEDIYDAVFGSGTRNSEHGGWVFDVAANKWYRRPLNIGSKIQLSGTNVTHFGDGSWYSLLSDAVETESGFIRYQVLRNNRRYSTYDEAYLKEYGVMNVENRYHKIPDILSKFLAYVDQERDQAIEQGELKSQYFLDDINPLPHVAGTDLEDNQWKDVLLIQNSDARRPESSEKATEETMSFRDFLEMICAIAECGWGFDAQGDFLLEHKFFFENGFSYEELVPEDIINPQGIKNTALNTGFLNLSNVITYDRPDMQKYEIYNLTGGDEPFYNRTRIVYPSPCANNLPDQNIKEYDIQGLNLDYMWLLSEEGMDKGLTMVKTDFGDFGEHTNVQYIPLDYNSDFVYKINARFSLHDIITTYHVYNRSFKVGVVNGTEMNFRTRQYILQDVFFPYRLVQQWIDNLDRDEYTKMFPYRKIVTEIGYGNIREAQINSNTGIMNLTIGYSEGSPDRAVIAGYNDPDENKSSGITTIQFYRHVQDVESTVWTVVHGFGTDAIYQPIVFKPQTEIDEDVDIDPSTELEEIGYEELEYINDSVVRLHFTQPVKGEAYFLAFDQTIDEDADVDGFFLHLFEPETASAEWNINHNIGVKEVFHSVIWKDGFQIMADEFNFVDADNCVIKFSAPVEGAKVYISYVDLYEGIVDGGTLVYDVERANMYPLKPLVMVSDKQIGYDYSILEEYFLRLGFSREVIATIIVKQYDR